MKFNSKYVKTSILFFIIICFFLPFFAVSCEDQQLDSYTGFELVTDMDKINREFSDELDNDDFKIVNILVTVVLIATILLLIYTLAFSNSNNLICGIATFINLVIFVGIMIWIKDYVDNSSMGIITVKSKIGYWLVVLLNIIHSIYSMVLFKKDREKPKSDEIQENINISKPLLIGVSGYYGGTSLELKEKIIIGRDPSLCQLVYPNEYKNISRKHCSIRYKEDEGIFILVNHSSNGTYLDNGEKLGDSVGYKLMPGNSFYLGSKENTFVVELER